MAIALVGKALAIILVILVLAVIGIGALIAKVRGK